MRLTSAETKLYHKLLEQCFARDLEAMKSTFDKIESDQSLQIPVQALAIMVARKGYAEILDFLLQKGATIDEELSSYTARSSIEMLELLWDRNWRDIQHSRKQQGWLALTLAHKPVELLEFLRRKGAKFTPDVFDMHDSGSVSLPAMKLLVEGCGGADSLKRRAVLTLAVQKDNRDVVKYLCELEVPMDDVPPEFDRREPYANCSPLWAAVRKRDISIVELLLEHGANPNAPYVEWLSQSLLDGAREHHSDDTKLIAILEKYALKDSRLQKPEKPEGQVDKVNQPHSSFSFSLLAFSSMHSSLSSRRFKCKSQPC